MHAAIAHAAVRRALAHLLDSDTLAGADQLRRLLEYLVRNTLEGRHGELNEIAVAENVLGRGKDFVALTDSSARKAMSRLRAKLKIYYAGEGRAEPIRFFVRRYRVRFRTRAPTLRRLSTRELFLEPNPREIPIIADVANRRAQNTGGLFE